MLPYKVQQKLYKWAWQGGIKQEHKIHRVELHLQNKILSVHAPFWIIAGLKYSSRWTNWNRCCFVKDFPTLRNKYSKSVWLKIIQLWKEDNDSDPIH